MSSDNDAGPSGGDCPNRLCPRESFDDHIENALSHRSDTVEALIERFRDGQVNEGNEDEMKTIDYDGTTVVPFGYQKGLGYETDLGNSEDRYEAFIDAVEDDEQDEYPTGGSRPLVSPPSAQSVATDGTDPWIGGLPPAPQYNSPATFLEMLEVYLMTYARDAPFAAYDDLSDRLGDEGWLVDAFERDRDAVVDALPSGEPTIADWIAAPGDGLFRDRFPGCRVGPYVSQHLTHDVPIGRQTLDIRIEPFDEGPFGTTFDEHETIVRSDRPGAEPGHADGRVEIDTGDREYAHAGIDLASQVRDDPAYQPYLLAGLQLFSWEVPYADDVPYESPDDGVLSYIDSGAVAMLDLLGRVTRNALLAAWHQKWYVHRRLRPETYAGRLHVAMEDGREDLFASTHDDLPSFAKFDVPSGLADGSKGGGSVLVPLSYPEGSPAHPAYPSGHSVIAGACATVLKTFFADEGYDRIAERVDDFEARASPSGGDDFEVVDDPAALTVHGEVNKLASNVGMGRIFAGVHYRTDHVYGMLLGEQIAVATLYDHFQPEDAEEPDSESGFDVPVGAISPDEPLRFDPLVSDLVDDAEVTPKVFGRLREGTLESEGDLPGPAGFAADR